MTLLRKNLLAVAVGSALCSSPLFAEEAGSIAEALSSGTTKLHLRSRYETVDQDGTDKAAATTLKTRLTYTSGSYNGFGLVVEMDDTTELGKDDYSDGNTARGTAAIVDPEGTEVNQAYLSYTAGATTLKYGRQRILLDNQRFVGGVGWRQDEQTYDGFSVTSKPLEGLSLFGAYITDVNRIFAEAQDHNHETYLLNAKYETSFGNVIGYGYLIDNKTAVNLSSDTMGLRWEGKAGAAIKYNLEYASQTDAGDSSLDYSADYMLVEVMGGIPMGDVKLTLKAGYEVLGADEGGAFTTSLATLHAFQGWTDLFLGTPGDGIVDTYFGAGSTLAGYDISAIYHTLSADEGDMDYGTEFGLVVNKKYGPVAVTFKYADYSADDLKVDTTKMWLMAAMTF